MGGTQFGKLGKTFGKSVSAIMFACVDWALIQKNTDQDPDENVNLIINKGQRSWEK